MNRKSSCISFFCTKIFIQTKTLNYICEATVKGGSDLVQEFAQNIKKSPRL